MPKTFTRRLATEDGTIQVTATVEITNPGYISVTAAVWLPEDIHRTDPSLIGQCPEYVTLAFGPDNPDGIDLTDFVDHHLSSSGTGEPLYAKENGWYWFRSPEDSGVHVPKHWEGLDGAGRAAAYLNVEPENFVGVETRAEFNAIVESLRARWSREMADLLSRYERM